MTPDLYMKTVCVEVSKRMKLRPWKKYKAVEQWREITQPWTYKETTLVPGFIWNGSSSPRIAWLVISPWKHPKASAYHDKKCEEAAALLEAGKMANDIHLIKLAKALRKEADHEYGVLVGNSDGKIMRTIATASTRLGSFAGAGW